MTDDSSTTIAILAGGKSQRMGADKAALFLKNRPMFEHVLDRVITLKLPIILIDNQAEKYHAYKLSAYPDVIPDRGSLGGLYTAITASETLYTLCVAVDMPFLNPRLLAYLISLQDGYDGVVPVVDGFAEPLHAVYSKNCLGAIHDKIVLNQLKISGVYDTLNIRFVEEAEIRQIDPELQSFININTPDEWQAAEDRLSQ